MGIIDALGQFMDAYDYHSDASPAEAGSWHSTIIRTLIICFDAGEDGGTHFIIGVCCFDPSTNLYLCIGHVNFQVAGYLPTMYDQFTTPRFIEMPGDVFHRSKHTGNPTRLLDAGRPLVQRKLVIHMGPVSQVEHPVDWTALCSAEELEYLWQG